MYVCVYECMYVKSQHIHVKYNIRMKEALNCFWYSKRKSHV